MAAAPGLGLDPAEVPEPELARPRQREFGDWSTNLALIVAPRAKLPPRQVAEAIVGRLDRGDDIAAIEVAGPGFINLHLTLRWLDDTLREILERGAAYGTSRERRGRAQVEFVSANPTGPLHVGTARNAFLGDALANLMGADGWGVEREYYWNDTGAQMRALGASIEARYLRRLGVDAAIPEDGYQGAYVDELAGLIVTEEGDRWVGADPAERAAWFTVQGRERMSADVRRTLERCRVRFDTWFSEESLAASGAVDRAVERLRAAGQAYEADGAVWFRATEYGDDKDRVLVRRSGEPTYFAKDVAYAIDKFGRGFDRLVYVWGADHHGAVTRLKGAMEALGHPAGAMEFVVYQMVSLYRGGRSVPIHKRTGDLVTLDELLDEVGSDAARYALLARSPDTAIDFDIEAVVRHSLDNPVYYVQYAHARIAGLLRVAAERGASPGDRERMDPTLLREEPELDLIRKLSEFPEVVSAAAGFLAPHRVTRYAEELAAAFHHFYTECRVISQDEALTRARLWLSKGTGTVVGSALRLLGVGAPESMDHLLEKDE